MRLVSREVEQKDLEECLWLHCCRQGWEQKYQDSHWRQLQVGLWIKLLKREAIRSGLVENLESPGGQRILAFGCYAFVRPEWLSKYLLTPFPHAGEWIVDEYAQGNDTVILTDQEVWEANSGSGLHSFCLCGAFRPVEQSIVFPAKQSVVEAFYGAMEGFNHNEFLADACGEFEIDLFLANDTWRIRHDFGNNKATSSLPCRCVLMGLTKAEAEESGNELSVLAKLFIRPEVRFFFPLSQQKLLLLARIHVSDPQLSKAMGIKMDALGRRFDRIYKRVEQLQDPDNPVFPSNTNSSGKRRLLLSYLEKNMAELRPYKRKSAKSLS